MAAFVVLTALALFGLWRLGIAVQRRVRLVRLELRRAEAGAREVRVRLAEWRNLSRRVERMQRQLSAACAEERLALSAARKEDRACREARAAREAATVRAVAQKRRAERRGYLSLADHIRQRSK